MNNVRKLQAVPADPLVITYAVRKIPIERIRAFADQPRKYFDPEEIASRAESMKVMGQQDPVTVEPVTDDPEHDYELINGESRLRSAQVAGIKTLWAAVRSVPFGTKVEKHLASLVANFNRSDHTPMEISDALHMQHTKGGMRRIDLARALGKWPNWVDNYLSLQNLHPKIQALLDPSRPRSERLSPSAAFKLATLPRDRQLRILEAARDVNGRVTMKRVALRAAIGSGKQPRDWSSDVVWSSARQARWLARNTPDPEHVKHLRAGIEEFRRMLSERWG
jgi:ParB family chromosome partitioning protein